MEPSRGGVNLGHHLGTKSFALNAVDLTGATDAVLTLNAWYFERGDFIGQRFNGGPLRRFPHPFPDSDVGARAVAIPVPLSELKQGDNTIELSSGLDEVVIANADLAINVR